jgi:uncharacterized protein YbaR (Trm112 family)
MHIELIDLLRCPRDHDETWMVAAFTRMEGRFVIEGKLGCPVCSSSYSIAGGTADLRIESALAQSSGDAIPEDPDEAMRLAALLNLTRPGALAILEGDSSAHAHEVSELGQCRVIALNPRVPVKDSERVATVLADTRLPFASSSVYGITLSGETAFANDIERVLQAGGRAVLPGDAELPGGLNELARDDRNVVAELVGPMISLNRR